MDLLHDRCAGLDVSKKDVKACVRSPGARANQRHSEVRTFATTTNALLELRDWLVEQGVTLVAMETFGCEVLKDDRGSVHGAWDCRPPMRSWESCEQRTSLPR